MKVEISNGELVDKVTILFIKKQKITDAAKLANVQKEYDILARDMAKIPLTTEAQEFQELLHVNQALWDIEDKIRRKEALGQFDAEFIALARSVYFENDKRATLKKTINEQTGSALVEEKQYIEYKK